MTLVYKYIHHCNNEIIKRKGIDCMNISRVSVKNM